MKVNIRPVREEDLRGLAEIYVEVYRVFNVGESWTPETAFKLLEHYLNKQPDLAFVAEHDGKLAGGFFVGIKPWWDGNHLVEGEVFVLPDYQTRGVGTELLKSVLRVALEKYQVTTWEATTFKKFDFPLSWYKRLGFKEIEEWVLLSGDVKKVLEAL